MTPIPDAWFHRIKAATRDQIKLAGGLERAGAITSLSTSALSRCQCATSPDIIGIPAALALEADAGAHMITAAMAALHGCELTEAATEAEVAARAFGHVASAMGAASSLMAASAEAAADGRLTPSEAERLDRCAAGIDASLVPLRQTLAAAKGARIRSVT
jgi:hypothetical protein